MRVKLKRSTQFLFFRKFNKPSSGNAENVDYTHMAGINTPFRTPFGIDRIDSPQDPSSPEGRLDLYSLVGSHLAAWRPPHPLTALALHGAHALLGDCRGHLAIRELNGSAMHNAFQNSLLKLL